MTEALFRADAYLRRCEARVVAAGPDGVLLDRTVFYRWAAVRPATRAR